MERIDAIKAALARKGIDAEKLRYMAGSISDGGKDAPYYYPVLYIERAEDGGEFIKALRGVCRRYDAVYRAEGPYDARFYTVTLAEDVARAAAAIRRAEAFQEAFNLYLHYNARPENGVYTALSSTVIDAAVAAGRAALARYDAIQDAATAAY